MTSAVSTAAALFEKGRREEAYHTLATFIADERITSYTQDETSIKASGDLIAHCLCDLEGDIIVLKRSALEILSWIFSSDFIEGNSVIAKRLESMICAKAVVNNICKILVEEANEEIICIALFTISEQRVPLLFANHTRQLCSAIFSCLSHSKPRNVRKYAYMALANVFGLIMDGVGFDEIAQVACAAEVIRDWKTDDAPLRRAALNFAEVSTETNSLFMFFPNAEHDTKEIMRHLWYV